MAMKGMDTVDSVMNSQTVEPTPPILQSSVTRQSDPVRVPGDMVRIPAGTFQMGSNAPEALH